MKTPMTFILCAMIISSPVMADYVQNNNGGNGNGGNGKGARCVDKGTLDSKSKERKGEPVIPGTPATTPNPKLALDPCEKLMLIAVLNNDEGGYDTSDMKTTLDGKVSCKKDGGYTIDFKDCNTVKKLYDGAILAETAMFATQKIIINESNMKLQKDVAAAQAKGDTQYGTIEAVIERNKFNSNMYKTQATTYGAAVTALSIGIAGWKGKKFLSKQCQSSFKKLDTAVGKMAFAPFTPADCTLIAEGHKGAPVFLNDDSKFKFITELTALVLKAAEAMRKAGIEEAVAKRFEKTAGKPDLVDDALDPCMSMNPPADCKTNNNHNITPGSFAGTTTGFGTGGGTNQDFNFDPDGVSGLGDDAATTAGADAGNIADMSSPFEQAAKDANGIFDPAGKAVSTPGGGGQQGGAGGGPGIGGGGSASLSDDPGVGAEDGGETDIKTNKVSGKYKAGGGGYGAVKGSKEDANPFASMFDAKGEAGGIEEDRSIASDDGEGSGLFHKISKKYGQVQEEKRLDSQNLE